MVVIGGITVGAALARMLAMTCSLCCLLGTAGLSGFSLSMLWAPRSSKQAFRSEIAGNARCPAATRPSGASTLPSPTRSAPGNRGRRSSRPRCRKSSDCDRLPKRHCCRSGAEMKADLELAVGDPAVDLVLAFDPYLALRPAAAVMND